MVYTSQARGTPRDRSNAAQQRARRGGGRHAGRSRGSGSRQHAASRLGPRRRSDGSLQARSKQGAALRRDGRQHQFHKMENGSFLPAAIIRKGKVAAICTYRTKRLKVGQSPLILGL